jgi:hypothetical protein
MNAHALAAIHTRQPEDASLEAWIAHTAAVTLAWSALVVAVREEVDRG